MEIEKIVSGNGFKDFDRYFVGYDDQFAKLIKLRNSIAANASTYPPYNIAKINEYEYVIEMAVAGFSEDDLDISIEENTLSVKGRIQIEDDKNYLHKGIAARDFSKQFVLNDQVVVNSATILNGVLLIKLERIVPESKKPRKIPISSTKQLLSE